MKSRILMYLFIFSVLLIVFQYVNSKNIIEKYEVDIETYKSKNEVLEAKLSASEDENAELNYFSIDNNEEALTYFEDQGLDTTQLIPKITDDLLEMNSYTGIDHPIVPYVSMTDSKIVINKIKVLNHKWVLANFTDGKYWGELFINYSVNNNGSIAYTLTDYFLYPVN